LNAEKFDRDNKCKVW